MSRLFRLLFKGTTPKLFFEAAFCFLFYKAFQTKEKHRPDWETVLLLHYMPPYSAPVKTGSVLCSSSVVLSAYWCCFIYYPCYPFSFLHNKQIPATKLTNNKLHTFSPVPIGFLSRIRLKIEMVMGRHQAKGRSIQPCVIQPMIRKTLITVSRVSLSPSCLAGVGTGYSTLHPHFTQTTASS